jgi:hypothetical protein
MDRDNEQFIVDFIEGGLGCGFLLATISGTAIGTLAVIAGEWGYGIAMFLAVTALFFLRYGWGIRNE